MHVDHLSFAASPDGLSASAAQLSELLGEEFLDGGFHPRFGTRNMTLPLKGGKYVELVEVLDHPAADNVPFGQAVRARTEHGGGWLAWVLQTDDMAPLEQRLEREAVDGSRLLPDGRRLEWKQLGIKGLMADPQLPFFVHWEGDRELHPSAKESKISLVGLDIAGDPARVSDWIGGDVADVVSDLDVTWIAPNGTPGILSATFDTPAGQVRI
ncbi:VOC family protein [Propionibacteriaceae bacterium Y1700]|uniref:VOC family protein n=1 Tax=Microlunatus sp. Y1700 TaxID=3418487 RepID=UPI003DA6F6EC